MRNSLYATDAIRLHTEIRCELLSFVFFFFFFFFFLTRVVSFHSFFFFFFRFSSLLACAAPRWSESISRCFRRLELLLHKATTLRAAIRCMLSLHQAAVKLHDATTQIHYNSLVHNFTTTVSSILHYAEHWPAPALKSFLAFTAFCSTPGIGPQWHPLPFSFSFLLLLSPSLPKKQSRRFFTHQFLLVRITFHLLLLLLLLHLLLLLLLLLLLVSKYPKKMQEQVSSWFKRYSVHNLETMQMPAFQHLRNSLEDWCHPAILAVRLRYTNC